MPSPFPGMDPYLEQEDVWEDFHESFVLGLRSAIVGSLGARYYAKVEQRLYIHELAADRRRLISKADVGVTTDEPRPGSGTADALVDLARAPAYTTVPLAVDVERSGYIEIRSVEDDALVTVVEMLSPSNKRPGGDRDQYLGKRYQLLQSRTHLVEIDLLRGGPRMPMTEAPATPYCVLVSAAESRPRAAVWPIALADTLPAIGVPLLPGDNWVAADLQAIMCQVYDLAQYGRHIYRGSPTPPLRGAEAIWAKQFVPQV
ncbi:MAG: DUF4058 family protein [Phycisphaerae bacterium]